MEDLKDLEIMMIRKKSRGTEERDWQKHKGLGEEGNNVRHR